MIYIVTVAHKCAYYAGTPVEGDDNVENFAGTPARVMIGDFLSCLQCRRPPVEGDENVGDFSERFRKEVTRGGGCLRWMQG